MNGDNNTTPNRVAQWVTIITLLVAIISLITALLNPDLIYQVRVLVLGAKESTPGKQDPRLVGRNEPTSDDHKVTILVRQDARTSAAQNETTSAAQNETTSATQSEPTSGHKPETPALMAAVRSYL
jgi:hypothetical protein